MRRCLGLLLLCISFGSVHAQVAPPHWTYATPRDQGRPVRTVLACQATIRWVSNMAALPDATQNGTVQLTSTAVPALGYNGQTWSYPVSAGQATIQFPIAALSIVLTFTPAGGGLSQVKMVNCTTANNGTQCSCTEAPTPGGLPISIS